MVSIEPAVRAVTVVTQMGSVLPLLTSSTGLVFAAYLPERETLELRDRELAALQQRADDYQAVLAGIRERGLHHVHGLLMPGVDALSAPVFTPWADCCRNDRGRADIDLPCRRARSGGATAAGGSAGNQLADGLFACCLNAGGTIARYVKVNVISRYFSYRIKRLFFTHWPA